MSDFSDELRELIEKHAETATVNEVVAAMEMVKWSLYREAWEAAKAEAKLEESHKN